MEEVTDFDTWLKNYTPPEIYYYAIYNPETYQVIGIYPSYAAEAEKYKLKIDRDLAEDIQNGVVKMNTCFVDSESDTLEIIEKHSLRKIDDIVYRIPDSKYVDVTEADVVINVDIKNNIILFKLIDNLKTRKVMYDESTDMQFFVTEYNDPHKVIQTVTFKLNDIRSKEQSLKYKGQSLRFSIFTRRLFKKYVMSFV